MRSDHCEERKENLSGDPVTTDYSIKLKENENLDRRITKELNKKMEHE